MTSGLLERASGAVEQSRAAGVVARGGLLARACFYVLLAYLVVRVLLSDDGPQVNVSGALKTVASAPLGPALVAAAAVGFLVFGISRLLGAIRDGDCSLLSRLSTGCQGGPGC